jgi:hypothetical protein
MRGCAMTLIFGAVFSRELLELALKDAAVATGPGRVTAFLRPQLTGNMSKPLVYGIGRSWGEAPPANCGLGRVS